MPPFKHGLLKRKLDSPVSKTSTEKEVSEEEGSDTDLIRGPVDIADDDSDSEYEAAGSEHSDHEQDEVLFDDDVDSTLGDEGPSGSASDESSDLSDSEEDGSKHSDESDSDEDHSAEGGDDSTDSGAESGVGQVQSSDEADKKIEHTLVDTKQKQKKSKKILKGESEQQKSSVDLLTDQIRETSVDIKPVSQKDEYSSGDSSDEEERVNTAGAVPSWWYREYPHVGYDVDGRRLLRPPQRDHIDHFLKQCSDPEFWRTVQDPSTGQDVRLSTEDLRLLQRLRQGLLPSADHMEYQPWVEWFSGEVLSTPVRSFPDHKRSFLPSRSDQQQISKLVHALKMGWAKTRKQIADERRKKKEKTFYNLWGSTGAGGEEEQRLRGIHKHIPAPRRPLPSHAESYNPPPEYLLDQKELKEWNKLRETPWKRKYTFLPTQYPSLRSVPAYERFTRERFLRCLDLYLAPRAIKMRLTLSPEELVPKLPSPRDLQPFPTAESLCLRGHEAAVRSADFDPSGQYIVSGSDDGTLKVWETSTGRCLRTVKLGDNREQESEENSVVQVAWCPARGLALLAAAVGRRLLLLNPGVGGGVGDHRRSLHTDELLREPPDAAAGSGGGGSSAARWEAVPEEQWARGIRLIVSHIAPVSHVSWHARGDYVCVTTRVPGARSVVVHQVSRRASQLPLARAQGLVQCALFHPSRPLLFVATQRVVRVYDLVKQQLVRKLQPGAQWISALAVHPAGDNLLVASFDRKVAWFDLELSARPYRTLRLHGSAVRAAAFHTRYPLFATGGDDRYLVVSHGMVYDDLLQNPLLVPLKQLPGGERRGELCVLALRWHPAQPWLLAAGADRTLRLYT